MGGRVYLVNCTQSELCDYRILHRTEVYWPDIDRQLRDAELYALVNSSSEESMDGHWFVKAQVRLAGMTSTKILGVAHEEKDLPQKTYEHSAQFAKGIAKRNSWEFVDLTLASRQA